jgi:hypothetical protein
MYQCYLLELNSIILHIYTSMQCTALTLRLHLRYTHVNCTANMRLCNNAGHLHVVKWLHENRKEGCTREAMDTAAGNGKTLHFQTFANLLLHSLQQSALLQACAGTVAYRMCDLRFIACLIRCGLFINVY